jgi:hypothetical protein
MNRRLSLSVVESSRTVPAGENLFYLCLICRTTIPSVDETSRYCSCRNVFIDPDAGRGGARAADQLVVLSVSCP